MGSPSHLALITLAIFGATASLANALPLKVAGSEIYQPDSSADHVTLSGPSVLRNNGTAIGITGFKYRLSGSPVYSYSVAVARWAGDGSSSVLLAPNLGGFEPITLSLDSDEQGNVYSSGFANYRWDASGQATSTGQFIRGASDNGIVIGQASGGATRQFPGDPTATVLGHGQVMAVNNAGLAVGYDYDNGSSRTAVRWDPNSTSASALESSPGNRSVALFVTNSGYIAGRTDEYDTSTINLWMSAGKRGYRWDPAGNISVLEPLDAPIPASCTSTTGLNEFGAAIGLSTKNNGTIVVPVRWDPGSSQPVDLSAGQLGGRPNDINALGAICGSNGATAVVWLPGSVTPIALNALISPTAFWQLNEATAISDTGFITGTGISSAGGEPNGNRFWTILVPQAGTYGRGDANFDTHVTFDDLLILAQHYGEANARQNVHVGDFDLNGQVNFDDLLALAQHYEGAPAIVNANQFGSAFAADWALARSLVPEPTTLAFGSFAPLAMTRRRRM